MNVKVDEVDEAYIALIKAVNKNYTYLTKKEKDNLINSIGTLIAENCERNDKRKRQYKRENTKRLFKGKVTRF